MNLCGALDDADVHIPVKHVCNSAAIIEFPEMHLDLVRPGIMLYGLYPSDDVDKDRISLKPAMTLKANVIQVKEVSKGTCISYGRSFVTNRTSKIATVPIGYADGYTRLLSNRGKVLVNGQLAPIVGRICMDQCMVDVSDLEGEGKVGDEVVLFGKQGNKEIKVEDIASSIGTINYEVVSLIGRRIPRVYIKGGKVKNVLDYLR